MAMFRRLFFVALLAGLVTGTAITAVYAVTTVPLILEAERYESSSEATAPKVALLHSRPDETVDSHGHDHAADHSYSNAWAPESTTERFVATAVTEVLTSIGIALLLVSAYLVYGRRVDWRVGLCWGLGGYAAFVLAPSLGLPPVLPGTEEGPLQDRQLWWLATALMTGAGLLAIVLGRRLWWIIAGLLMLVLPHLYGAPGSAEHISSVPPELARDFVIAALSAGLVFWLVLGTLTGFLSSRLLREQ